MASPISEDDIEQALLQKLQHVHGYDVLECGTAEREDLADGSGRTGKREVFLLDRLRSAAVARNPVVPEPLIDGAIQKVKLAAKAPLERLAHGQPKVLVQEWYRDTQSKRRVQNALEEVLHKTLPEDGYDRLLFKAKCDAVFGLVLDLASHGRKWVA